MLKLERILNIWSALFPAHPRVVVHQSQEACLAALDAERERMNERRRRDLAENLFKDLPC